MQFECLIGKIAKKIMVEGEKMLNFLKGLLGILCGIVINILVFVYVFQMLTKTNLLGNFVISDVSIANTILAALIASISELLMFVHSITNYIQEIVGNPEISTARCDMDYLEKDNSNNQMSEHLNRMKFLSQKHSIRKKKEAH